MISKRTQNLISKNREILAKLQSLLDGYNSSLKPLMLEEMEVNFLQWLGGLIDADGSFVVY